jgi:hypothetical protein
MPRQPIELARKHYEELPAILKQALFSAEIAEQMFEIGKKFGLTIEKTGIMAEETGYVILGLGRPNELVGNLASGLHVDTDKAKDIGAEINHQIFFPLREELKRTHDFDMDAAQIEGLVSSPRVSGMPMPPSIKLSTGSSLIPSGVEAIKKTFIEEKSSLVSDLTRIREQNSQQQPKPTAPASPATPPIPQLSSSAPKPIQPLPSFVPPASQTGRIADLDKMSQKLVLPVKTLQQTAPPPASISPIQPELKPLIAQPKELPELKTSFPDRTELKEVEPPVVLSRASTLVALERLDPRGEERSVVEPWEKDMKQEVAGILIPKPIPSTVLSKASTLVERSGVEPLDLRPLQKSAPPGGESPPPLAQTKILPIDLRKNISSGSAPPPFQLPPVVLSKASTLVERSGVEPPQVSRVEPPTPAPTPTAVSAVEPPRTTPQLHDWSGFGDAEKAPLRSRRDETILEANMRKNREKLPPEIQAISQTPPISPEVAAPIKSAGVVNQSILASSDPYREPIDDKDL